MGKRGELQVRIRRDPPRVVCSFFLGSGKYFSHPPEPVSTANARALLCVVSSNYITAKVNSSEMGAPDTQQD